ncbi:MAG: ATP-binding protein [Spongiibacteraceae bacterium]|jgi:signal transduction histidine kinase/CheY-like chemotaxis protein|nr:ATP-binding protein [Spongiibacteraceae bacterium]
MLKPLLLLALLVIGNATIAGPLPAPISIAEHDSTPLNGHAQYLVDEKAVVSGEALLDGAFGDQFQPLFGHTLPSARHWVWLRFQILNTGSSTQQLVLSLNDVLFEAAELHYVLHGTPQRLQLGLNFPLIQRDLRFRTPSFPVLAPPDTTTTYYLGLRSHHMPVLAPALSTVWHFAEYEDMRSSLNTAGIGILSGMWIYLAVIALMTRNIREAAPLGLVILAMIGMSLLLEGYFQQWFPHLGAELKPLYVHLVTLVELSVLLFARHLLARPRKSRSIHAYWWLILTLALVPSAVELALGYEAAIPLQLVIAPVVILMLSFYGAYYWYRGSVPGRLFTIGMAMYALITVVTVIAAHGLLPYGLLMRQGYQLGAIVMCFFFSLGLAAHSYTHYRKRAALNAALRFAEVEASRKSDFLIRMSHEIRTPINGMLGVAQLLQASPLNTTQKSHVNTLMNSATLLLSVVNEILDLAKIATGRMRLEQKPLGLDYLLAQSLALFLPTAKSKGVNLTAHMAADTPLALIGDRTRVQQVLNNLISNALKFTREGRIHIRISHRPIHADCICLIIEVEDSGPGISAAQLRGLFEPFTSSSDSRPGNSGLGLSISRQLAQLMGGDVTVTSNPESGSTFCFTAMLKPDVDAQAELDRTVAQLAGRRVLLAVGDRTYREGLCEVLERTGVIHTAVSTTDAAIVALTGQRYDAALMGSELFPASRQAEIIDSGTPIVVMHSTIDASDVSTIVLPRITRLAAPCALSDILRALARQCQPDATPDTEPASAPDFAHLRVLVAEDNTINQQVINAMLQSLGIKADIIDNGRDACARVTRDHAAYDLVLLDCEMPELDGWQAARRIRNHLQGKPLAIVALTAHAGPEEHRRCLAAGMDDVLLKPVLLERLRALLQGLTSPQDATPAAYPETPPSAD